MSNPLLRRLSPQLVVASDTGSRPPGHQIRRGRRAALRALLAALLTAAAVLLVLGAATTHGFLSISNVRSILSSSALVGIVGVGMSLLVLSGNLFSLSLGVTAAIGAMLFLYSLQLGVVAAILITLLVCAAICASQGAIVGAWAANPIIVTIGAGAIQQGVVLALNGSGGVFANGHSSSFHLLISPVLGVPFAVYVFLATVLVGEMMLRRTRFGREVYLLGESRPAARAAALPVLRTVIAVFAGAGVCAGIAGVLLGAQSGHGELLLQGTLTFDALAAVLVGGSAIGGGHGSIVRTALGAVVISTITDMLLIRGYAEGTQLLVKGLLVVIVVVIGQSRREQLT